MKITKIENRMNAMILYYDQLSIRQTMAEIGFICGCRAI